MGRRKREIEEEEREEMRREEEEQSYRRYEEQYGQPREETEEDAPMTRKEKIAYEKELVKEGKIIPRYSPRNPLGRILALILIFFFGLFAMLGGIIGTFAYLGTRPVKDGLSLFNLKYDEFITEDAANKSVLDLVETVKDFQSINTLDKIKEYTPLVDKLLGGVNDQIAKIGVHIDLAELSATPFDQLGNYFSQNVVQGIVLGEVLSVKPDSNPLLVSLCYGEENVDYTVETVSNEDGSTTKSFKMLEGHTALSVGDLTKEGADTSELLNKLSLENVLGISAGSDPAMRYLAYGSEGVHYEIVTDEASNKTVHMLEDPETHEPYKKKTVADLTGEGADLLGGAKISDLIDTTDATGIIGAVKDWTITDMGNSDKLMELYIRDIVDVNEGDGILGAIKDKQLKDLADSEEFKTIKISAIIDTESATGILKTIADKDWTIGDLSNGDNFKTLKIEEIVPLENATGIMKSIKGWTIDDLSDSANIEKLKINEIIENPSDGILGAMSDWSISDLSNTHRIERIKISQIIGEPKEGDSLLMQTIASWRIGDVKDQAKLESLTLSSFLTLDPENDPQILISLADTPIGEFGSAIDNMRLSDVLGPEIKDNKLLSKLANSTLGSLNSDIQSFSIGDLFGDELYSFLEIRDGKTYADLVKAYETDHTDQDKSANPITPVWKKDIDKSTVKTYYKHNETEVAFSLFERVGDTYRALNGSFAVYPAQGGGKYIEREIRIAPVYAWKVVDYANGGLKALPEGAAVGTDDRGLTHAYEPAEGETAATENGTPLYYVAGETAYPLLQDTYSIYYKTGEDFKERVDLDKEIASYKNGEELLPYADGKVTYAGAEYAVRTSNAGKYDYILAHVQVTEGYAVADQPSYTAAEIYARDEVTEHWRAADGTELDRFLDGVWYLLFGGETWNADKTEMTVVDNTHVALFEVAQYISGVTDTLNSAPLWKLYLHGIIEANPFGEIRDITTGDVLANLNEFSMTALINYVTTGALPKE